MEYGLHQSPEMKLKEKNMERRKKPEFKRTDWNRKPRFSIARKVKWRRAKGRHNKIREKRKSNSRSPSIGYGMPREIRGLVQGMMPVRVQNVSELSNIGKNQIGVISSRIGAKKKMQIAEQAVKLNVKLENFNAQKFLDAAKKNAESKKNVEPVKKEEKKEASKGDKK